MRMRLKVVFIHAEEDNLKWTRIKVLCLIYFNTTATFLLLTTAGNKLCKMHVF